MSQNTMNRRHFNTMLTATAAVATLASAGKVAKAQQGISNTSDANQLIGPYEHWTYGDGLQYNIWQRPGFQPRYIAAVATRKLSAPPNGGVHALATAIPLQAQLLTEGKSKEIKIPLWEEAFEDTTQAHFIPVIRDFGIPPERQIFDKAFIVSVLAAHRIQGPALPIVPEDIGYRLNAPIPVQWIDLKHSTQSLDDHFKPDTTVVFDGNNKKLVIMAVIDDGIPFAHRNFRDSSGQKSRVEFCWLQSGSAKASGTVPFGQEITRTGIEGLISQFGADEDSLYAKSGALENSHVGMATLNHRTSHGAHIMDLAAGNRPEIDGSIDHMRIIAVQLPAPITIDTTGVGKDAFILSAFHYIFDRADRIAKAYLGTKDAKITLVINFSYGFTGGPHDGKDKLEIAISNLIRARGKTRETKLVMAAGNTFNSRMNGEIKPSQLNQGQRAEIPWRIQPNDHTSNYLEVWIPAQAETINYSIDITDGLGRKLTEDLNKIDITLDPSLSKEATKLIKIQIDNQVVGQFGLDRYDTNWWRMTVFLAPTESNVPKIPVAPSGLWKIGLKKVAGPDISGPITCRIQRDNDPFGYTRGARQSYFDHPQDILFHEDGAISRITKTEGGFVTKFGTLNGLATHSDVIVVSGYYDDTQRATEYGAVGADGKSPSDHQSAPSDNSTALRGIMAAGTRSGIVTRLSGTSVAAPQVARQIALGTDFLNRPSQDLSQFPIQAEEQSEQSHRLGTKLPKKMAPR